MLQGQTKIGNILRIRPEEVDPVVFLNPTEFVSFVSITEPEGYEFTFIGLSTE